MKQLVNFAKPAAIIAAAILTTFAQPVLAADHKPHPVPVAASTITDNSFSIELSPQENNEIVLLSIKNPGKKNLSVSLNSPGGLTLDNFYVGKRSMQVEKTYNFTEADSGLYTLEVSDGKEKIKKQIKLERVVVPPVKLTVQ